MFTSKREYLRWWIKAVGDPAEGTRHHDTPREDFRGLQKCLQQFGDKPIRFRYVSGNSSESIEARGSVTEESAGNRTILVSWSWKSEEGDQHNLNLNFEDTQKFLYQAKSYRIENLAGEEVVISRLLLRILNNDKEVVESLYIIDDLSQPDVDKATTDLASKDEGSPTLDVDNYDPEPDIDD